MRYSRLLLDEALFLDDSVGQTAQGDHCPRGYDNMFNGTCYLLSHDKETWVGAMVCTSNPFKRKWKSI